MLSKANRNTWTQIDAMERETTWFLLPISATEQHGPHLPVGTDQMILEAILERFEERFSPQNNLLVLPALAYGNSVEHCDYPGTVSLSCRVLVEVVEDIIHSLTRNGFENLIILNSHGGNTRLLHSHAQEWASRFGVKVYNVDFWESAFFDKMAPCLKGSYPEEIHAGEIETSIIYHAYPEFTALQDKIEDVALELSPYFFGWASRNLTCNGTLGYPSLWSGDTGEKFLEFSAEKLCTVCQWIMEQ